MLFAVRRVSQLRGHDHLAQRYRRHQLPSVPHRVRMVNAVMVMLGSASHLTVPAVAFVLKSRTRPALARASALTGEADFAGNTAVLTLPI